MERKDAAQQYLANWQKAREFGTVGLVDPHRKHLDRPIRDHVTEYLQGMAEGAHKKEVSRVVENVFNSTGMAVLRDWTADRISRYLTLHPAGFETRKKHRVYLSGFSTFLFKLDRIPTNVIDRVPVPIPRVEEKPKRNRRRYTLDELQRLLKAAREYPIAAREVNGGGRPRRDGTPAQPKNPPKLSPEYRQRLTDQGKDRELMYRLLLGTGLRRRELSRVTVAMFNGEGITVPKGILKHKPKHVTHLIFPIAPNLAGELKSHVIGKKPTDRLVKVPNRSNLIREHQARLKMAGVPYQTEDGFADVHAMRTTINMILKRQVRVQEWERKLCLRHSAKGVTDRNYDPDNKKPVTLTARVFKILSALDRKVTELKPSQTTE